MIPLEDVFAHYGHPDPATVSTISRNGQELAYVGHAEITKALSEIDASWTWEPVLGPDGLPLIRIQHGLIPRRDREPLPQDMATMWGRLTLNGVTRWAVGSVESHKPDLDKELVSDFLRNAAMRFNIALGLWMKSPAPDHLAARHVPAPKQTREAPNAPTVVNIVQEPSHNAPDEPPATEAQERALYAISKKLDRLPPAKGTLTKRQAGQAIEQLQAMLDNKTANTEKPF
jgi:hypothetical protein